MVDRIVQGTPENLIFCNFWPGLSTRPAPFPQGTPSIPSFCRHAHLRVPLLLPHPLNREWLAPPFSGITYYNSKIYILVVMFHGWGHNVCRYNVYMYRYICYNGVMYNMFIFLYVLGLLWGGDNMLIWSNMLYCGFGYWGQWLTAARCCVPLGVLPSLALFNIMLVCVVA